MAYYDDELALREAQINRKRKRNRKRLLIGAGAVAGGALALNNEGIRNKVTNHLRSDSQMMNNIGNGVRKVGKGIYNNFKPSATTMSIRRETERAADAISNYAPKYNKRRRRLANIIDDLYHSGYSDGYYDGMELYHADDEMTEEERRARRRKRRRNVALGVAGVAGAGAAGYAIGRALRKRGRGGYIMPTGPRLIGGSAGATGPTGPSGPRPKGPSGPTGPRRIGGPILKRVKTSWFDVEEPIGWDFKRNKPKYADDKINEINYRAHAFNKYFTEYDHDKKKWIRRDSTSYRH